MTSDTKQAMFGSADDSAEFPVDVMPGLADLTMTSLAELAELDESFVDDTLDRLLPRCAAPGSRQWNRDGESRQPILFLP